MTNTDIGPRPEEPYGIGQGQDSEAQFVRILEWEEARADKAEAEVARLRGKLVEAYRIIKQAKQQFAPNTTNSDADCWLKRNKELGGNNV